VNRVAIVGCGDISRVYGYTLGLFDWIDLVACADVIPERADERARTWGARAMSLDAVLADPDVDVIVNLTPPAAHAEIDRAALAAGKAVYSEKPLGVDLDEGREVVELAEKAERRVGCAPDTFLGAALQACRAAIDRGDIGEPLAASAFMLSPGPERWHPNPGIFYQRGAGPLFDIGPYYISALVQLLGPARRVSAMARRARDERTITSEPLAGQTITVEVPTHVTSTIEFVSGATASLVTSFDARATRHRGIEVYGTEATLALSDPVSFAATVMLARHPDDAWEERPLGDPPLPQFRGVGAAEMVWALRAGRPHRASHELALHTLEVMSGAIASSEEHRAIELRSTCPRAAPLPDGLPERAFDD
jgi:predicted dehydrogenase